jgi:hypothetical protein
MIEERRKVAMGRAKKDSAAADTEKQSPAHGTRRDPPDFEASKIHAF